MNYQKIDYDSAMIKEASTILDVPAEALLYYAWPQTYGSTAGPFSGMGGQAISTFTIEAFTTTPFADRRDAVLFCKGQIFKRVQNFNPAMAVRGVYR